MSEQMELLTTSMIAPELYNDTPLPGWHQEIVVAPTHNLYGPQENGLGAVYYWPPDRNHRVLRSEVEVRAYLALPEDQRVCALASYFQ